MADPSPPVGEHPPVIGTIGVQMLYTNGFAMQMTATEVGCIFMYDSAPQLKVVIPFSVALSLVGALQKAVSSFEQVVGSKVLPLESLSPLFKVDKRG